MTRLQYGGGPEDVYQIQDGTTGFTKPGGGYQALFYTSSSKTTPYTDLQTLSGQPISYVTTQLGSDGLWATGQIAPFYGPDGVFEMWVSVAGSPPFLMQASNLGSFAGPLLQQLTQLLAKPDPQLGSLNDVDSASVGAATTGQALVKGASGLWIAGSAVTGGGSGTGDVTTATAQTITATKTFTALQAFNAGISVKPSALGNVGTYVQGLAGQTGNLVEWRNSAGAAQSWVGPDGNIYAPNGGRVILLSKSGALATGTGTFRYYADLGTALKIRSVRANVGTASTSGTPTFDVKVNGTTIYGTVGNRPAIAVGAFTSGKNTGFNSGATIPDGAYVTVDVTVAGTAAADAVVQIECW